LRSYLNDEADAAEKENQKLKLKDQEMERTKKRSGEIDIRNLEVNVGGSLPATGDDRDMEVVRSSTPNPLLMGNNENESETQYLSSLLQPPTTLQLQSLLPPYRRDEVTLVLTELLTLKLHPEVSKVLLELDKDSKYEGTVSTVDTEQKKQITNEKNQGIKGSDRTLLLKLFPLLCDCIRIRDGRIRDLLCQVFHLAARDLQLESDL